MSDTDTNSEAVELVAALYSEYGPRDDDAVAALLRALLAERDAARLELAALRAIEQRIGNPADAYATGFAAGAEAMREAAASIMWLATNAAAIRALPIPERGA